MKKTLLVSALAALTLGSAALSPAIAAPIIAPPQISDAAAQSAKDPVKCRRSGTRYDTI